MTVDVSCAAFLLCAVALIAPWAGLVGCVEYTLAAWVAVVIASRCVLARVLSALGCRMLGDPAAVSIGGCSVGLLGGLSLTDLRLRLPVGPLAQARLEISSIELGAALGPALLGGGKHGGVKVGVGHVQAALCLRPGWGAPSAAGTRAAPASPRPAGLPEGSPPAAAERGSRLKALLLRLVQVDVDAVAVVASGCRTAESELQQLSLVLPGVRLYTQPVEGESGVMMDLRVCIAHPVSVFSECSSSAAQRALRVGGCEIRARLAGSSGAPLRAVSWKVETEESVELHVNSALLATVLQLAAFAKAQRPVSAPRGTVADEKAARVEFSVGGIVLSASLGGQTVAAEVVGLVGSPNAAETKQASITMNGHKLVEASDGVTYTRAVSTNTQALKTASLRIAFPHELHFGNSLAEILTDVKAVKRALASSRPSATAARGEKCEPVPTFVFVCDDFRLDFADDPLDGWLNSRYPHLRVEHDEVVVDWHAFDQKCDEEFGVGKADPEMVQQANHLIREQGAKRYRERLESSSTSGDDIPVLGVAVAALELKLVQDDWACSLDGMLARMDEYGGELPAEARTPFSFTELIGRTVSLDLQDTRVQIRDFSFPLLKAGALHLSGPLIIAEQSVSDMFCLRKGIAVGDTTATVAKTLAPMKVFHSLRCEGRDVELNYGVAMIPALADASNAAARLSSDSLDPAKPLPWWDKLRYKLHGKLSGSLNSFRLRLLADHSPHVFNNNMVVDITNLELDLDGNNWRAEGRDMSMKLVTPSAELSDSVYFPVLTVTAGMQWKSKAASHYVQGFAKSVGEAFPNKAPAGTSDEPGPAEWWGAVLGTDALLEDLPADKFRAESWKLDLQLAVSGAKDTSASVNLWQASLAWLGALHSQLISPPRSRAAVMKMPRSKVGLPRKQKMSSLGELLDTLDLQLNFGQATLRFWNKEDVCLEAALAAAGLRQKTVVDDPETSPPTKITGVHVVANNVVARFLVDVDQDGATRLSGPGHWRRLGSCGSVSLCHNTKRVPVAKPELPQQDGDVQLPPSTPDSEILLENLFDNRSSVPPETEDLTRQGSHLNTDGVAVLISDMLMWCSLDSRNTLYDWILSFDSVVESAIAKTPRTRAQEKFEAAKEAAETVAAETMQSGEDLLAFLSRTRTASKIKLPVPPPVDSVGGHPHATVLSVRFVRPQIRLESEAYGSIFLTAMGATIENSTHSDSELTRMTDDAGRSPVGEGGGGGSGSGGGGGGDVKKVLQVSLDQAQMFAAPAGSMQADERIPWKDAMASQTPITTSHVVLGRAQRILAPCPIHVAYTRWKRQDKQRANSVTVHIDSAALAMNARHYETLQDVFENVLLIRCVLCLKDCPLVSQPFFPFNFN